MKKSCIHLLGYYENERYDSNETTFVNLTDSLCELKKIKMIDGSRFDYCPNCGKKLESVLEDKMAELEALKLRYDEEVKQKKEKVNLEFLQKMEEIAKKTGLDQLEDNITYMVIFHPMKSTNGKDYMLSGDKDLIIRNSVNHNYNRANPEELIIKKIEKVYTIEQFSEICLKYEYVSMTTDNKVFEKTFNENNRLSLYFDGRDSRIYATRRLTDQDGDTHTNYDQFYYFDLEKYLVEIESKK